MSAIERVALIYDDKICPHTTGIYCRRALGQLVDVEHFLPEEVSRIPTTGFDLYLNIDDGLRYRFPDNLHPSAWWAIDTHLDLDWYRTKSVDFDFVFTAQRDGAICLREAGIHSAQWLPLACDPEIHRPQPSVDKLHDVCFVGHLFPGPRTDLVRLIQSQFPKHFVGEAYLEDMVRVYAESKTVFNRSIRNDVNMRVFEALGCGAFLVTNALSDNGQSELFQDGVHLVTYESSEELLDKLRFYLQHPDLCQRIANKGREDAWENHTYRHRMERILDVVVNRATDDMAPIAKRRMSTASVNAEQVSHNGEAEVQRTKDFAYFEFARPELLALVPHHAGHILEVGCGAGRLGATIKQRQQAHIVGVECDPLAAHLAQERLDEVFIGTVEELGDEFRAGQFDCVICGDVLEHLQDPLSVLKRICRWLTPDGELVVSIPNARHHSVVGGLLDGNWTYEPAGILDDTHLHFWTRFDFERLLYRAGFQEPQISAVPGPSYADWQQSGSPGEVRLGSLHITGLPREEAEEFFVYQWLTTATPAREQSYGLTSIVILTCNALEYTRQCVESIQACTDDAYELIFIDNASTDGTQDYLRTLSKASLIENAQNRGIATALNQGIETARGEHLLLMNNDVVVTTGWLWRMLDALYADPDSGIVGPLTNWPECAQQIEPGYGDLGDIERFAWNWGQAHASKRERAQELIGFCLLMRRALVDDIGHFDERFGLGMFEDKDFSRRAIAAGKQNWIARDAFVHHVGHRTYLANKIDSASLFRRNRDIFNQYWTSNDVPSVGARGSENGNR